MVYAGRARESVNQLRLLPRSDARQTVEAAHIEVTPATSVYRHRDVFGNEVAWFQLDEPHERLIVESQATVTVAVSRRPDPPPPGRPLDDPGLIDELAEFLLPSSIVRWGDLVKGFAHRRRLGPPEGVAGWLGGLELAVNAGIAYRKGVTDVDTSVEHVVRTGQGVCQDMAHLFIALCRRQGVPARYISGWMHQAGRDEPSESHAWCEAWIPGVGWVEFDPTHPEPDLSHYIRVAVGRDYADVPPFRGTYVGDPTERMIVTVEIEERPLDEAHRDRLPSVGQSVSGG